MNKRKIVKVVHQDDKACVFLDDGSELVGLIHTASASAVSEGSTVELTAYVYPCSSKRYVNTHTGQQVCLTEQEAARFFDNRDPAIWRESK